MKSSSREINTAIRDTQSHNIYSMNEFGAGMSSVSDNRNFLRRMIMQMVVLRMLNTTTIVPAS
jgi:hypothetical protein